MKPDLGLITVFLDLVFHELLHTWVVENFTGSSPLLEKYKNEPAMVRNHLHLMAIQKLVYLELGRTDLLAWIGSSYSKMREEYVRAWDIVNRIEGHETFIAEIKNR